MGLKKTTRYMLEQSKKSRGEDKPARVKVGQMLKRWRKEGKGHLAKGFYTK